MTDTDRIAQMAREAGFAVASMDDVRYDPYATSEILLARFARLVAEDCAKVCEGRITPERITRLDADGWSVAETNALATGLEGAAQAIRARYSKETT